MENVRNSTGGEISIGDNASGGTVSPGASVQSSQGVSEEDDANDSSLPELGGRDNRRLRWLGETPIVLKRRTRGE